MAYTDFAFYTGTYLGDEFTDKAFAKFAERASEKVDEVTRWQVRAYLAAHPGDMDVQKAVCAVAEVLQQADQGNSLKSGGAVKSEITSKHHVTYADTMNSASSVGQRAIASLINEAAGRYLRPLGLMNRGVDMC